jgi:hypothetical protein
MDLSNCEYIQAPTSFEYKRGALLRQAFTREVADGEARVKFGAREGSYRPWWKETETLDGKTVSGSRRRTLRCAQTIAAQAQGGELRVKSK